MDFSSGLTRTDTRRSWHGPHGGKSRGFTLIELIVVVAIVGIFAAIAIPGFSSMIRKNSVTAAANELYDLLQYSRGEAITRRTAIIIKADGGSSSGWNGNVTVAKSNDSTNPLRALGSDGLQKSVTVASAIGTLTFSPTGNASSAACFKFTYANDQTISTQYVTVLASGRVTAPVSVDPGGCP